MLRTEYIQASSNIAITTRERGKIVGHYASHNIFVSVGLEWLAQLICGEVTSYLNYMGVGIGGTRQTNPMVDVPPFDVYPTVGARSQTDTDMNVTAIERPVCITSAGVPITPGSDVWLKAVAPPSHPASNRTMLTCVFAESEISFGAFSAVPISELGLFTSEKDPLIRTNQLSAYDTLLPITKTTALELEVRWTIAF